MKQKKEINPPRWAQRFLEWYCRPELLEDLQGDLNEYFQRNVTAKGIRRARFIYCIDVLKFLRLYTLRKPEFINLLINFIMIGSYIKTSGRSIVRHKLFSAINIIGLAISMSVGLLVIAFISDLYSYDDFHRNKERIYRLTSTYSQNNQAPRTLASTSVKAGKRIQETIPGVDALTIMRKGSIRSFTQTGETSLSLSCLWANESFFNVFTFPLLQGNPANALKEPYSIVLTEKSAIKLFGTHDVLGKSLKIDTVNYLITGLVKDVPKLSHLKFEALVSFSTLEQQKLTGFRDLEPWENIFSTYVFLVLPPSADIKNFQANLDKLCKAENVNLPDKKITLTPQPLRAIILSDYGNELRQGVEPIALFILISLAAIIIFSACFNYTNLSIARSMRRSREVGIRKVSGALKWQVRGQFITESIVISMLALVLSLLLFLLLRGQFLSLHPFLNDLVSLDVSVKVIIFFIVLALVVGLAAGFLPAIFFSQLNAAQVLKDASSLKIFRFVTMRKVLIVVQYTFSIIFITTTIIGYTQYKNFLTLDLGFTTKNILNISLQGNDRELLASELSTLPDVDGISKSFTIPGLQNFGPSRMTIYQQDSATTSEIFVDDHYLSLHEHVFLAGRNFTARPENAEETEVIINEQLLKRFDITKQNPDKAIGEILNVDGMNLKIVGVLKDFHHGTVEQQIEPVMFRYLTDDGGYLNVKISSTDVPASMAKIENLWKTIDKVHPMEAKLYDDQIEEAYNGFSMMIKATGFLALLAVSIASMGMFGMAVYTTETRLKEISIRKVLGASEGTLIYLLGKGFLFLLVIAALIALPFTYLTFEKVLLVHFAYHQPVQFFETIIGFAVVMIIAFIMIGSQTFKTARSNPAQVLKSE